MQEGRKVKGPSFVQEGRKAKGLSLAEKRVAKELARAAKLSYTSRHNHRAGLALPPTLASCTSYGTLAVHMPTLNWVAL